MNELVYPRARRRPGAPRLVRAALLLTYVAVLVLAGIFLGWWPALYASLGGLIGGRLAARTRTVVTSSTITSRGLLRKVTLPVDGIRDFAASPVLGGEVWAITAGGNRHRLAGVKPGDLAEIRVLTGRTERR